MSFISQYIPKDLELSIRANAGIPKEKPSASALDAAESILKTYHYRNENGLYEALVNFCALFLEGKAKKGLLIRGISGIGKSFGVSVLARHFGWPLANAKIHLEEAFMAGDKTFEALVKADDYFGKPVPLIIDDLGVEACPLNRFGTLYNIMADALDARYLIFCRTGTPTIVTTNLKDSELEKRYGIRVDSRFNEMFEFVNIASKIDLRKQRKG